MYLVTRLHNVKKTSASFYPAAFQTPRRLSSDRIPVISVSLLLAHEGIATEIESYVTPHICQLGPLRNVSTTASRRQTDDHRRASLATDYRVINGRLLVTHFSAARYGRLDHQLEVFANPSTFVVSLSAD